MMKFTPLSRTLCFGLLAGALLLATSLASAQTRTIRSKEPYKGIIVPESLPVYSGRADVFDRIGNLAQGQIVIVREVNSFGWCSIAPPPGFFAFIAERDVELNEDGIRGRTIGRTSLKYPVNDDPLQSWRICKVNENTDLLILDTRETKRGVYYKVSMPESVNVYIDGQFIRRATEAEVLAWEERMGLTRLAEKDDAEEEAGEEVAIADATDIQTETQPITETAATPEIPEVIATPLEEAVAEEVAVITIPPDLGGVDPVIEEATPVEVETTMEVTETVTETDVAETEVEAEVIPVQPTQPQFVVEPELVAVPATEETAAVVEEIQTETETITEPVIEPRQPKTKTTTKEPEPIFAGPLDFNTLEELYKDVKKAPTLEAEIEPLLGAFRHLSEDKDVDETTRRRARARVTILGIRLDHQKATRRIGNALSAANRHQKTEDDAKAARTGRVEVTGILKGSSVYDGVRLPALYRLVDDRTGRTDCYIRPTNELILSDLLGTKVHIIGKIGAGPGRSIEVITPTTVERVGLPVSADAG